MIRFDLTSRWPSCILVDMAQVKDGKVVNVTPKDDKNDYVTCDRCGRTFPIKHEYCVCRG